MEEDFDSVNAEEREVSVGVEYVCRTTRDKDQATTNVYAPARRSNNRREKGEEKKKVGGMAEESATTVA